MKGRVISAALATSITALNFTVAQAAAFDNLPWDLDHEDEDVLNAATVISQLSDEHAQHLASISPTDELYEVMSNVQAADEGDMQDYQADAAIPDFEDFLRRLGIDPADLRNAA